MLNCVYYWETRNYAVYQPNYRNLVTASMLVGTYVSRP